jgi:miniconductance mechanosensitive channel
MNAMFANWLAQRGLPPEMITIVNQIVAVTVILIIAYVSFWATKRYLVKLLELLFKHSKNTWDDALVRHAFVKRISYIIPTIIVYLSVDLLLPQQIFIAELIKRLGMVFFVIAIVWVLDSVLLAARDIYDRSELSQGKTIRGYTDAIKIIAYLLAGIFIISTITDKSPWGIISILGGFTVVLMLVFKDTILGFVASIQLSGHDMVRVGDWIEMGQYGADGDVIDVSIHTVKVRNWDKTITTIPTYALVTHSFKNWRGMSESGGRRIKRSLYIDMTSVRFCSDAMLARFEKIALLKDYLHNKNQELIEYNREHQIDANQLINGRRQTNLGVFRAYIIAYLRNHPKIHQNMTFLVRHLEPTPHGLPIQIYVFSNDQAWANYEAIQADIFDHLLAAVEEFELRVFQNPTGYDFKDWARTVQN